MRTLSLLVCLTLLGAAETWSPTEHPAILVHQHQPLTTARRMITLASEVQAPIRQLALRPGQAIPPQAAIVLDDSRAQLLLAQAESQVLSAQQQLASAQASSARVQREAAFRAREAARIEHLSSASEQERDTANFQRDAAQLAFQEMQSAVAMAQSQVTVAQRAKDLADDHLQRHRLALPTGLLVAAVHAEEGALAVPGQPLITLADCSRLEMSLLLSAAELQALRDGHAKLRLMGQEQPIDDIRVLPEADPVSRNYQVTVVCAPLAQHPGAGHRAELLIPVPDPSGALTVPASYVLRRNEQDFLHGSDGRDWPIRVLRREENLVIFLADNLPATVQSQAVDKAQP